MGCLFLSLYLAGKLLATLATLVFRNSCPFFSTQPVLATLTTKYKLRNKQANYWQPWQPWFSETHVRFFPTQPVLATLVFRNSCPFFSTKPVLATLTTNIN